MALKITDFRSIKNDDLSPAVNFDMLAKFVDDTKDSFPPDYDIKVLTFVGKYATGKSTMLNALSALLKEENNKPDFVSANEFDRKRRFMFNGFRGCTIGLMARIIIKKSIKKVFILIDTQGTKTGHQDATDDTLITLFSYRISDIIMVNTNDFSHEALRILEDITLFGTYFNESAEKNKPVILFRLYDSKTNNISEINNMFNNLMADKSDNLNMTRNYIKSFFSTTDMQFVWSGRPSEENIKQMDSDRPDIEKFIEDTPNYHRMCQLITFLLLSLPQKKINFHQILVETANYVNGVSSRIKSRDIIVYKNLTDESLIKHIKFMLNSTYQNILTPFNIMDCSEPTLNLIISRKNEIDEFKCEINKRFANSQEYNILMGNLSRSVDDRYNQMVETFNNHRKLVLKNIYLSIKSNLSFVDINVNKTEWHNKEIFEEFINKLTIGLCRDISEYVRRHASEKFSMIAEKFSKAKDQFNSSVRNKINEIRTAFFDKKHDIKEYVDKLHLTFEESMTLYLYRLQNAHNIVINASNIRDAETIIDRCELKGCGKVTSFNNENVILVNIPRFTILYNYEHEIVDMEEINDAIMTDYVDLGQFNSDLVKLFNDLRSQVERYRSKFAELREKRIPQLLELINTRSDDEILEHFELIKHNDLYLLAIEPLDTESTAYQIFKSNKENYQIMTSKTFVKRFGKSALKFYKKYHATDDKNMKDFIRGRIYNIVVEHQINEEIA